MTTNNKRIMEECNFFGIVYQKFIRICKNAKMLLRFFKKRKFYISVSITVTRKEIENLVIHLRTRKDFGQILSQALFYKT